jgi:hypothetical protein
VAELVRYEPLDTSSNGRFDDRDLELVVDTTYSADNNILSGEKSLKRGGAEVGRLVLNTLGCNMGRYVRRLTWRRKDRDDMSTVPIRG